MKLCFTRAFTIFILTLSSPLEIQSTQDSRAIKPLRHHEQKHGYRIDRRHNRHEEQPQSRLKTSRKHKDIIPQEYNQEQQALYNEIHILQKNIRKNMYALGQERRAIKNLTTTDSRKKCQENINKICNEIKHSVEEHQPRIIEAIDNLS